MENLSSEELIQLVNFYRQRAADLELQVLQLQLKIGKHEADHQADATNTKK